MYRDIDKANWYWYVLMCYTVASLSAYKNESNRAACGASSNHPMREVVVAQDLEDGEEWRVQAWRGWESGGFRIFGPWDVLGLLG